MLHTKLCKGFIIFARSYRHLLHLFLCAAGLHGCAESIQYPFSLGIQMRRLGSSTETRLFRACISTSSHAVFRHLFRCVHGHGPECIFSLLPAHEQAGNIPVQDW